MTQLMGLTIIASCTLGIGLLAAYVDRKPTLLYKVGLVLMFFFALWQVWGK